MESSMEVLKNKIELPCDLAIPLLSIYPKDIETLIWKDISCVHSSIIFSSQDMKI